MKEKLKSWPLWTSLAALVCLCVKEFTGVDITPTVNEFLNAILSLLIAFGIINNPNDRQKF